MNYKKARADSRGFDPTEYMGKTPCEMCLRRLSEGHNCTKRGQAAEVHHIETSYRGARTHKEDGTDLLGVCNVCHSWLHSWKGNTRLQKIRQKQLARIGIGFGTEAKKKGFDPAEYAWKQRRKQVFRKELKK